MSDHAASASIRPTAAAGDESAPLTTERAAVAVVALDAPEFVLASLSSLLTVRIVESVSFVPHGRCLVAVAMTLHRADVRARLRQIRQQRPASPLVIVTSGDAGNLRWLLGLHADGVVTVEHIEDEIGPVVRSLECRSPLERAAAAVEEAETLDEVVRAAILTAARSVPPIHTVKGLAKRLGAPPDRLSKRFKTIALRTGWSCLDLLHAIALWRTVELLANGSSLKHAWEQLCLDPRTLRRASRALLQCPLSRLRDHMAALERAILEFVQRAVSPERHAARIDRPKSRIATPYGAAAAAPSSKTSSSPQFRGGQHVAGSVVQAVGGRLRDRRSAFRRSCRPRTGRSRSR